MANLAKVTLLCRVTRDPEARTFANGGKVVKLGVVVNNRIKKGADWVDDPMFIDVEAFDRGEFGKNATKIEEMVKKGSNLFIEGKLKLETWDDKVTGSKRSKHKVELESWQFLDKKADLSPVGAAMADSKSETSSDDDGEIPF
jgi:single-strand DNA-binding protein